MKHVTTVYCDESGFTGPNLLDAQQPFFVYSLVAITETDAELLVQEARSKFSLGGVELKSATLLKSNRGKHAISWLLEKLAWRSRVIFFDKRYALCGKIFECLIEPAIRDSSEFYYDNGFHRFIADGLYVTNPKIEGSVDFLETLMKVIRCGSFSLFESVQMDPSLPSDKFYDDLFTVMRRSCEALQSSAVDGRPPIDWERWALDLTASALWSLLIAESGTSMKPLNVFCDEAKPLKGYLPLFQSQLGGITAQSIQLEDRQIQLNFKLASPIKFGCSDVIGGLQLADIIAGSFCAILSRPATPVTEGWLDLLKPRVSNDSVVPCKERINNADLIVRGANLLRLLAASS